MWGLDSEVGNEHRRESDQARITDIDWRLVARFVWRGCVEVAAFKEPDRAYFVSAGNTIKKNVGRNT